MKLQGKIKSIPITHSKIGMQILLSANVNNKWQNIIGKITKVFTDHTHTLVNIDKLKNLGIESIELKILVIEYTEFNQYIGENEGYNSIKQIPLKYSQWQAAVDTNEVDSDKIVEFKIIFANPDSFNIAKIIPSEKSNNLVEVINKQHLEFIYNRMIDNHSENPHYDYMLKFKEIINNYGK